jgi:8-oxo-dGTP diphosphatase
LHLEPSWCLVELGVLAGARRQGMAQALHDALLQTATLPTVVLSTQVNNTAALEFYKKNGYSTLLESLVFTPGLIPYTILGKSLTRVSEHGLRSRAGGFIVRDGQVLLMQRQKPERGTYFVIPGGSCENLETLEQSAIRELLEETNLEFTLGAKLYESYNPKSQRTAHYFIAQYQSGEPSLRPDAPEILEKQSHDNLYLPTWIKLEDVKHLPLFPSIIRNRLEQDLQHLPTQPVRLEEYD